MSARSERLLATILENVPLVLWEMDAEGIMQFQDGKGLADIGLERHASVGKKLLDLYPDSDEFRRARSGEQTFGSSEANGRTWESWYVPTKRGTEVLGVVGLSLDVTEKKRAEQELRAKLDLIERQREVIRELSVPIIQVWDRVLAVPLTGLFDSKRAAELNEELLLRVTQTQASFVILDLTGVDILDTATANRLILLVRALGLLGCMGIVTGIRPGVAQAIVDLGVELSGIRTFSLLRDGLRFCMQRLEGRRPGAERALERGSAL